MKYIRTKDNKFITLPANEKEWATLPESQTGGLSYKEWFDLITKDDDILKSADTIEELCDEFVCDHQNGTRIIRSKSVPLKTPISKETINYFKRNNQVFYGAIWTKKGLIYVAKMNDEGELCLI